MATSPKLYRVTISAVTGIGWECDHLYHLSCKKAVYGTKNERSHSLVGVYQTSRRSFGLMRVVYRPVHVMEANFGDYRPGPERPRQIAAATM